MDDLVVYGHIISQPFRSVATYCDLSEISYRVVEIDFPNRQQRSEEYTKINPFQEFPAIVHNGFNLWESPAIVTYLSQVYCKDNQWYPKDLKIRGRVDAYLLWHHSNLRLPILNYYREKSTFPYFYGASPLDPEKEKGFIEKLNECLQGLDWVLGFTGFVAQTEDMTIADVFAFNEVFNGQMAYVNLDAYPRIAQWYERVQSVPQVKNLADQAQVWINKILNKS